MVGLYYRIMCMATSGLIALTSSCAESAAGPPHSLVTPSAIRLELRMGQEAAAEPEPQEGHDYHTGLASILAYAAAGALLAGGGSALVSRRREETGFSVE
jgi:hypothetical protein